MSRWDDYPRMADLVEFGKQAHKLVIAYFITKMEKDVDIRVVAERGILESLNRVMVTDMCPNVYHQTVC